MTAQGSAKTTTANTRASTAAAQSVLFTPDEVDRAASDLLTSADDQRSAALDTLALVHQARASVLTREAGQLEKSGDPRAHLFVQAAKATTALVRRLSVEANRAKVVLPKPTETTAQVQGHVIDAANVPVQGAKVLVVGSRGKRIRGATASTDAGGFFSLEWTVPKPSGGAATPPVRLRVFSGSKLLHQDKAARMRPAGSVDYVEINVPGGKT